MKAGVEKNINLTSKHFGRNLLLPEEGHNAGSKTYIEFLLNESFHDLDHRFSNCGTRTTSGTSQRS